jgi:hypothetical protein
MLLCFIVPCCLPARLLHDVNACADLSSILPADQCTHYLHGSDWQCAVATVVWDMFQVCRMDAGGHGLSKRLCTVWKNHIPLLEKLDYRMDMITLHTKGYSMYDSLHWLLGKPTRCPLG